MFDDAEVEVAFFSNAEGYTDWLKLCLLLSFCYLKLQYKLLTASILEWNGVS